MTGTRSHRNKGMKILRAHVTLNLSAAVHKFYKTKNHLQILGNRVVTWSELYTEDQGDGVICETQYYLALCTPYTWTDNSVLYFFFYVLLAVHLSIFISVINQLYAQNFCFTVSLFHASTCFEHICSPSPIGVMIPEAVQCNFDLLMMSTCARNM